MVSNISASHLRSDSDPRKVRLLLRWQSSEFDGRMWCGSILLGGLRLGEFIFFTSYTLVGLALPFSFFFTLLKYYDLQPHHLSPHSITLVVIFVHLCEMYVGVRPSVHLFWLFTCCTLLGEARPTSTATTSSATPGVQLCTSPSSVPASGTTRGMIRWLCKKKSITGWSCRLLHRWAGAPTGRRFIICSRPTTPW
jgi:hypothetical protein